MDDFHKMTGNIITEIRNLSSLLVLLIFCKVIPFGNWTILISSLV